MFKISKEKVYRETEWNGEVEQISCDKHRSNLIFHRK